MQSAIETLPPPVVSGDIYEVYAMRYATSPEQKRSHCFMRGAINDLHDGPMPLDFFVWIIRNSERLILVDTGFGHKSASERQRPIFFAPHEGLARIGIPEDSIKEIILTHLHFDHAGGLDRYPNARFHIQDSEVEYATGRCMCHPVGRFAYDVEDVVTLVRRTYAERVMFHDGDADIFPGISVHLLPGHSQGIQGVRVNTARGPVLLASDASHCYENFSRNAPYAIMTSLKDSLNSYRRFHELVEDTDHIIPGHDPLVRSFYPSLNVQGIELSMLHEPVVSR